MQRNGTVYYNLPSELGQGDVGGGVPFFPGQPTVTYMPVFQPGGIDPTMCTMNQPAAVGYVPPPSPVPMSYVPVHLPATTIFAPVAPQAIYNPHMAYGQIWPPTPPVNCTVLGSPYTPFGQFPMAGVSAVPVMHRGRGNFTTNKRNGHSSRPAARRMETGEGSTSFVDNQSTSEDISSMETIDGDIIFIAEENVDEHFTEEEYEGDEEENGEEYEEEEDEESEKKDKEDEEENKEDEKPEEDEHKDEEHKEDEHKEDEHKEDEHKEDEHKEGEHKENEHKENEHKEDEHKEDDHKEDEEEKNEVVSDEERKGDEVNALVELKEKVSHLAEVKDGTEIHYSAEMEQIKFASKKSVLSVAKLDEEEGERKAYTSKTRAKHIISYADAAFVGRRESAKKSSVTVACKDGAATTENVSAKSANGSGRFVIGRRRRSGWKIAKVQSESESFVGQPGDQPAVEVDSGGSSTSGKKCTFSAAVFGSDAGSDKADKITGDSIENADSAALDPANGHHQEEEEDISSDSLGNKKECNYRLWSASCGDPNADSLLLRRIGEIITSKRPLDNYRLLPTGFKNFGNYCYVNAVAQALIACKPFINLMAPLVKHYVPKTANVPWLRACLRMVKSLPLVRDKVKPNERCVEPSKLSDVDLVELHRMARDVLSNSTKQEGVEEDAQEFLCHFINSLHEEMLLCIAESKKYQTSGHFMVDDRVQDEAVDEQEQQEANNEGWRVVGTRRRVQEVRKNVFAKSPMSELFVGTFRSCLRRTGLRGSINIESFLTVPLVVQAKSSGVCDLKFALRTLLAKETVYVDGKDGSGASLEKSLFFETLPTFLIFHLKYFAFSCSQVCKLVKPFKVPKKIFIEPSFMSEEGLASNPTNAQRTYTLRSVIFHHGKQADRGHYTCAVEYDGKWHLISDGALKPFDVDKVEFDDDSQIPYLMFYGRQ